MYIYLGDYRLPMFFNYVGLVVTILSKVLPQVERGYKIITCPLKIAILTANLLPESRADLLALRERDLTWDETFSTDLSSLFDHIRNVFLER